MQLKYVPISNHMFLHKL